MNLPSRPSLANNYLFAMISSISQIAFPLVTFPYVSRVLGPSGMGSFNFANSIVAYFILLSALGIGIYGQRLVAKNRGDRAALSVIFSTLSTLHFISTLLWFCVYLILLVSIEKFHEKFALNLIAAGVLLANTISFEWFFKGVEDFKYIAVRSLIIRLLLLGLIFALVRNEGDEMKYMVLTVLASVVPYIYNIIRMNEYADYAARLIKLGELKSHLVKMIPLSVYALLTNIYTVFPVALLGFVSSDYSVGIFTVAQRICLIVLTLFSTASAVLFPRMTQMSLSEDKSSFNDAVIRSVDLLIPIAATLSVYLYFFAELVVSVIAGGKYKDSIDTLKILSPVISLVAIAQICVSQILLPRGEDAKVLKRTGIVAAMGLAINCVLISWKPVIGASISVLCSELLMTGLLMHACWSTLGGKVRWAKLMLGSVGMIVGAFMVRLLVPEILSHLVQILISTTVITVWFVLVYVLALRNASIIACCNLCWQKGARTYYRICGRD